MSKLPSLLKKPIFYLLIVLPVALLAELFALEGFFGASLPSDRGSAISSYEIREKGREVHFITRNREFSIVDIWSNQGKALEALVLRETVTTDREDGIEGDNSTVQVEALDGTRVRWSFKEAGETGRVLNQLYEVTKYGCCDAPNTYTYFSLRDGTKLRAAHAELSRDDFEALEKTLYY